MDLASTILEPLGFLMVIFADDNDNQLPVAVQASCTAEPGATVVGVADMVMDR